MAFWYWRSWRRCKLGCGLSVFSLNLLSPRCARKLWCQWRVGSGGYKELLRFSWMEGYSQVLSLQMSGGPGLPDPHTLENVESRLGWDLVSETLCKKRKLKWQKSVPSKWCDGIFLGVWMGFFEGTLVVVLSDLSAPSLCFFFGG